MAGRFVGADGCRAGWVAVTLADDTFGPVRLFAALAQLVDGVRGAEALLVDIPMGLKEAGEERRCDVESRRLLGPRGSTLFRVPVRQAVYAPDHPTASAINRAATGKGLSIQSYGICPKIAEADQLLQAEPALQGWVHESHPELCFAAWNGWQPLLEKKKSPAGVQRRLGLLSRFVGNAEARFAAALERYPRSDLARDDILDAMVLALSARGPLVTLPAEPERDLRGLRMAITLPGIPSLPRPPGRA